MAKRTASKASSTKSPKTAAAARGFGTARSAAAAPKSKGRTFDALPDAMDFRDKMYIPTLIEVPSSISLDSYRAANVPILDQGAEGACTGFGLATVAHYLLRSRKQVPDGTLVAPRMFYEMAKRYDEWPGENYDGSSARGAMKGWQKHGVCPESLWPYSTDAAKVPDYRQLTSARAAAAAEYPLGAYFRVNHKDIVAMHSAIAETGVLFATSSVHSGWDKVGPDGIIPFEPGSTGGHAFAIVAYDHEGFWIQNSWGADWGKNGFCRMSYDDWLLNATDVWVARLGAAITLNTPAAQAMTKSAAAARSSAYSFADLRPHIISIGNNGLLRPSGTFGTREEDVQHIFRSDFQEITKDWKTKRLLLYAHGGLTSEDSAIQRLADLRSAMLDAEVYPISFIWKTDFWTTITNILKDAISRRRPEGILDSAKDFMLDRLDDGLEPIARVIGGKLLWSEMKENGQAATTDPQGGARLAMDEVAALMDDDKDLEVHIAGHSAGSIFMAPFIKRFTGKGAGGLNKKVTTCTLWAPAATVQLFKDNYIDAIKSGAIERFAIFTLTDKTEQDDDCAQIYHKSLLYLVSSALDDTQRIPIIRPDGEPIIGMEKFIRKDPEVLALFTGSKPVADWILSPNAVEEGKENASRSLHHGDFDDDTATLRATLARILDSTTDLSDFEFQASASAAACIRKNLGTGMSAAV